MSFQFKQFTIEQKTTAMKVGTDGVLLGAWSSITGNNILDIGTGTGLIALMLAQRSKTAIIDAIELEHEAYQEAKINITKSNWSDRINAYYTSIQQYQPNKKYDTIVSNPPFFIDSTNSPNTERNTARHTGFLSFEDLAQSVGSLLKPAGIFAIILPSNSSNQFIELAKKENLFLNRACVVKPNPSKTAKRMLMEFSFSQKPLITEELTIETETRHQYTKDYISLTQDFYLNF